jgi:hypothetical protein
LRVAATAVNAIDGVAIGGRAENPIRSKDIVPAPTTL